MLSNSFDFTLNRNALITRALRMISVVSASQTPTQSEITDGSEALNLLLKSWQADGLQLWTVTQKSVTPVQGQYKYTFGSGGDIDVDGQPVEVFEVYRRTTTTVLDVPMNRVSRENYWRLGDKDTEGTPTQFYFDTQLNLNNFYIWPSADASFATDNTIEILYQKPFDDMDSSTDNLAFPQTWELAVVYGLAHLLSVEYGRPNSDARSLKEVAEFEKRKVMDWDTEHTSIFFTPA